MMCVLEEQVCDRARELGARDRGARDRGDTAAALSRARAASQLAPGPLSGSRSPVSACCRITSD